MPLSVGEIEATLRLRDELTAELTRVNTSLGAFGSNMERIGSRLQSIGGQMTAAITVPLAGMATAAVRAGLDFEGQMNRIQGVTRASGESMEQFRERAIEMGNATVFSATDAAEAMLELSKAGFSTQESMAAVADVMTLAAAGNLEMGRAAEISARAINAFDLEVSDLAHVNDVLAKAVNESTLEIEDLAVGFRYIGPIATDFGISIEQASAALAIMRDNGVEASTAGRALREALGSLANPVGQTADAMERLGIETFKTADGSLMPFADIISLLQERGVTAADALQLFGNAAGPAMMSLISTGRAELDRLTASFADSEGAAQAMADAMMQGLPGAFERFRGAAETALIAVSKAMEPFLVPFLHGMTAIAEFISQTLVPAFESLPDPVQAVAVALLALVAVGGPLLMFGGTVLRVAGMIKELAIVQTITGLFTGIAPAATAAAAGTSAVATAMSTVVPAATATGGALKFAAGEQLGFFFGMERVRDELGRFTPRLWHAEQALLPLSGAIEQTAAPLAAQPGLWQRFGAAVTNFVPSLARIGPSITTVMTTMTSWEGVMLAVRGVIGTLGGPIGILAGVIGGAMVSSLFDAIGGWEELAGLWDEVKTLGADLSTIIGDVATNIGRAVTTTIVSEWNEFKAAAAGVATEFGNITGLTPLINRVAQEWEGVRQNAARVWEEARNGITQAINWVHGYAEAIRQLETNTKAAAFAAIELRDNTLRPEQIDPLAESLYIVNQELDAHAEAQKKIPPPTNEATEAMKRQAEALQNLRDELSGKGLLENAERWIEVVAETGGVTNLTREQKERYRETLQKVREHYEQLGPAGQAVVDQMRLLESEIPLVTTAFGNLNSELFITATTAIPQITEQAQILDNRLRGLTDHGIIPSTEATEEMIMALAQGPTNISAVSGAASEAEVETVKWKDAIGELSEAFAQLAQIAPASIRGIVQAMGTLTGAIDVGTKSWDALSKGFSSFTSGGGFGSIIGGLAGMTTGIGGLISVAVAALPALKGLWNGIQGLFGNDEEARDVNPARDAWFLSEFGARAGEQFDMIVEALGRVGVAGEEARVLIDAIYQADTMEEFEAAIGAVEEALASQGETAEAVATGTAEAFESAATRSGDAWRDQVGRSIEENERLAVQTGTALDAIVARFADGNAEMTDVWRERVLHHMAENGLLGEDSEATVTAIAAAMAAGNETMDAGWADRVRAHMEANGTLTEDTAAALAAMEEAFYAANDGMKGAWEERIEDHVAGNELLVGQTGTTLDEILARFIEANGEMDEGWRERVLHHMEQNGLLDEHSHATIAAIAQAMADGNAEMDAGWADRIRAHMEANGTLTEDSAAAIAAIEASFADANGAMTEDWNERIGDHIAGNEDLMADSSETAKGIEGEFASANQAMDEAWMNRILSHLHENGVLFDDTVTTLVGMEGESEKFNEETRLQWEERVRDHLINNLLLTEDSVEMFLTLAREHKLWTMEATDDVWAFSEEARAAMDEIPRSIDFVVRGRYEGPSVPGGGGGGGGDVPPPNTGGDYVPPIEYGGPGAPEPPPMPDPPMPGEGGGYEGFATGTGGFRYFGDGTMVELHGWERVQTRGQASAEGGGAPTLIINVSVGAGGNTEAVARDVAEGVMRGIEAGGMPMHLFRTLVRQVQR